MATFRSDPALLRMKVRQRWSQRSRPAEAPPGVARPRVASIDRDLAAVVAELTQRQVRTAAVYGDAAFDATLREALPTIERVWISHRGADVLAGAALPGDNLAGCDVVVVGGADVKVAYVNALRWLDRFGVVKPVLWVGQNFEFCGSTLPIPAEVDGADIYLFHHFADYFPIKDPLLVRVSCKDSVTESERLILVRPRETVHYSLDELLPQREGTAVVEVRTTHPALTGNRHPRWRVWADLSWKESVTSLHGAHDYGPDHVCESRIALSECPSGRMVVTLPNYDRRLDASGAEVRWTQGDERGTLARSAGLAVEQITVPGRPPASDGNPFLGYRYQGHGTSYWFAFEEGASGNASLCGNHEVTLAQVEHRPALSADRRSVLERIEERGFLLWPHGLPITDPADEIEFGFSFEAANPQVFDFRLVALDEHGAILSRATVRLPQGGYHYAEAVLAAMGQESAPRPAMVLVSPDWDSMGVDPQHINAAGNLVARSRRSGDRDITEFQSCWRNLNATIDGFPHWLHPSKGVVGRTNVVGHVRSAGGLRTAILVLNGSGNLQHSATATVRVQLFAASGVGRSEEVVLPAFTWRLLWLDELFAGLAEFLGEGGYGACLVTSGEADVNCQMLASSPAGAVSLQHLWGY